MVQDTYHLSQWAIENMYFKWTHAKENMVVC